MCVYIYLYILFLGSKNEEDIINSPISLFFHRQSWIGAMDLN